MRAVKRESRLDARGMEVKRSARSTAARGARERRARSRRSSRWRRAARSEGWRARGRTPLSHCCCSSRSIAAASGDAIAPDLQQAPVGVVCGLRRSRVSPRVRCGGALRADEPRSTPRPAKRLRAIEADKRANRPSIDRSRAETTRRSGSPAADRGTRIGISFRKSARGTFGCRTRRDTASARKRISRSSAAHAERKPSEKRLERSEAVARPRGASLRRSTAASFGPAGRSADRRHSLIRRLELRSSRYRSRSPDPSPKIGRSPSRWQTIPPTSWSTSACRPSRDDAQCRSLPASQYAAPGSRRRGSHHPSFHSASRKDTEKSFAMMKKSLQWRESGANQCLSEPLSEAHAATSQDTGLLPSATAETAPGVSRSHRCGPLGHHPP